LIFSIHFNNLRGVFYGGPTAAVVALPLALAFGVASGIGPVALAPSRGPHRREGQFRQARRRLSGVLNLVTSQNR